MKRIISLKKISPFLTEVFRDDLKIGTIDYQNSKDYQINLDDTIAQAVMDAEVAAIKKALEDFMDNFTLEKMKEMEDYKNLTLIVDLNKVKNDHVATITQVFSEKKQLLLTDYENYKKNVTTENNAFKVSAETETKNMKDLSISETGKIQAEGSRQITDIGLLGDTKKNILEADYLGYKTELESIVNINNFEKLIGKNFKGAYDPTKNYQNGDIYYKTATENVGFSIPNTSSPKLIKTKSSIKVEKFLIYGDIEQEFQLCSNKQFGIVGLNLGKTIIKEGELNSTSAKFPNIFSVVGFSIPNDGTTALGKKLINLNISSPVLEKTNIEMPLHQNLVGAISKYQY
ncbi:MAG: hypothetical protein RR191_05620 [Cetobacterium sp.]|uniref:hypothetical protein n=1 Tax=Cetobacterium sp. TaxID=2071632 RepID=UPI002FCB4302